MTHTEGSDTPDTPDAPARTANLWITDLYFFVDGATQGLAYIKFYHLVGERLKRAHKQFGVRIPRPASLEPRHLWQAYMDRTHPYHPGMWMPYSIVCLSLGRISEIKNEFGRPLPTFQCWLRLHQGVGKDENARSTWEESTRWIWKTFEAPFHPDIVLVSVEENRLSSWS